METILQKQISLSDALINGVSTFENGCNYTLLFEKDGAVMLSLGCYGVHVNLAQNGERLLLNWLSGQEKKQIPMPECQDAVAELKSRKPCKVCGGFLFKREEA
ncbi:hypothetical protein [Methylobacterium oryzae]|uniref:hypothetical protein n=1 Tax=Methylobacterium oryzae TaxID=334852 RepID=UPI002F356BD8